MDDPLMPDPWDYPQCDWHAVDGDGRGHYFYGHPPLDEEWGFWGPLTGMRRGYVDRHYDLTGLDWRNSLRHRPEKEEA